MKTKPIPSILTKIDTNLLHLLKINEISEKNNAELKTKIKTDQNLTSQCSSHLSEYLNTEVLFQRKPDKGFNKTFRMSTVRSSSTHMKKNSIFQKNNNNLALLKRNSRYMESSRENEEKLKSMLNREALTKIFANSQKNNQVLLFKKDVFKENQEIYKDSEYILINSNHLLDFFKYSLKLSMTTFPNEGDFWKNMQEFITEEENSNIQKFHNTEYKFLKVLNEKKEKGLVNRSCEFSSTTFNLNKSMEINKNKDKCSIF